MVSAAGAIGSEVLKGIGKKYLEEKNAAKKEERKNIDIPRNNIFLQRLPNLRRVQLPNNRIFFAKYKSQ